MIEFLSMGGHGAYVWTAYGLSLAVLVIVGFWPLLAMRGLVRTLKRRRRVDARAEDAHPEKVEPA